MCFVKAYVVNNTTPFFFPEKTVVFLNIISVRLQKKKKENILQEIKNHEEQQKE